MGGMMSGYNTQSTRGSNDRVTFLSKIGSGVFGEVWKAKYEGDVVAAKTTECPTGFRDEEVAILRRAQGDYTVKLLGEEERTPKGTTILMELCEGNLQDRITKDKAAGRRLSAAEFLRNMEMILEGLSFLHTTGIVFGDLKPDNLLIHSDGRFLFADFGDARDMRHEQIGRSVHEMGWGSPMYHARPDVMRQKLTTQSDMWMLAQTAIHLWTYDEARSNPSPLPHDIPLFDTLRKCFASEATDRPTAADMLHECRAMQISSASPSPSHSPRQHAPEREQSQSPISYTGVTQPTVHRRNSWPLCSGSLSDYVNDAMVGTSCRRGEWVGVADWEMAGFFPPTAPSPPHFTVW